MKAGRTVLVPVLALAVVLAAGLALGRASRSIGDMESCWVLYSRMVGDAEGDRQVVDPRNPEASHEGPHHHGGNIAHDQWVAAGDFLLDCVTAKLSGLVVGSVRFAHVPGAGMPHVASFAVHVPEGTTRVRAWLFAAPLWGARGGVVPRVEVDGRVAWDGEGPAAEGPLATEMPVLPGDNEITLRCDPAEPVAAVLVFEALEE